MNTPPPGREANGRWWLDPALAKLAFDEQAGPAGLPISMVVGEAIGQAAGFDPAAAADQSMNEAGYEVLEILGQGGMGVVYRARQRDLDREVALKVLAAGPHATSDLAGHLRLEARHAGRLQHPNIVTVHGLGHHDGLICYAMELVRGQSLAQRLEAEGPLPPQVAAQLLRTVAEAVDYAHRLGVLHLDLKPGNILIDEDGTPLISDFGLARPLERANERQPVAGTPSYMSPEQVDPEFGPVGPGSDIWGLGAILYEVLTGHVPFEAETPSETLRLLLNGQLRHPSRYRAVPPDLEAICLRCLAKHPDLRYPSARALADDLGRYLEGREVTVRRLPLVQRMLRRGRREPRELMILALLGLLALAFGGMLSQQWQAPQPTPCIAPT